MNRVGLALLLLWGTACASASDEPVRRARQAPVAAPVAAASDPAGTPAPRKNTAADQPRFFFAGNGRLHLGHAHFGTELDVQYRRADGTYDEQALGAIDHFFRSRADGRQRRVALRLIELLAYVQQRYRPKAMALLSGYRSPEFNADLGAAGQAVAMASLHTQGLAADVALSGVDLKRLWLQLRELQVGGVGYYKGQNFLHIDGGPPRFWEATTSRVSENLSAGNARMFVRTDFDRYDELTGAVLGLHSVTTLPLHVSAAAQLIDRRGSTPLTLAGRGAIARDGECWAITVAEESYQLAVVAVGTRAGGGAPDATRPYIVIKTCTPRIERTPAEVRSNPIELTAPAQS